MTKLWGVHMPEWIGDDPIERDLSALAGQRLVTSLRYPMIEAGSKRNL